MFFIPPNFINNIPESFSDLSKNIPTTSTSETLNMFNIPSQNTSQNIFSTNTTSTPIEMPNNSKNNLLLLYLSQMQQIFQQNSGDAELINQAIIAEKKAITDALIKIKQQKQGIDYLINKSEKNEITHLTGNKRKKICSTPLRSIDKPLASNTQSNKNDFFTRCGITWTYLTSTNSINEFDDLRRRHQVSKNRHVGYGVRYACTRNAKARDNCPYLLLNIPDSNGIQHVYSRNSHTHPIRHIRSRNRS